MKKIFFLTALLCASVMGWATVYDDTELTLDAGQVEGQTLTLSICRNGANSTRVVAKSTTSTFTGVYECIWQGYGGGTNPVIGEYTVTDHEISFTTEWDTYPTAATQLRFVARRNNTGGGSDIFGGTATDADISGLCDGVVILDDPELTLDTYAVTLSAEAPAETHDIVASRKGNGAISYESDKTGIASVSNTGVVTAVGRGTATITVRVAATASYEAANKKLTVTVTGPINWGALGWIGNGTDDATYTDKFKAVASPAGMTINNLQINAEKKCIHVICPSAEFGACTLAPSNYHTEGAGLFIHLNAFSAQETQFTLVCGGTTYTFDVYYADGEDIKTAITNTEVEAKAVKMFENGQLIIIKNGVKYNALGAEVR